MEYLPVEKEIAEFFSVLSVETRLKIIRLISTGPLCVNAIAHHLDMTQSAVSQHLRVLRNARLVEGEKRGYFVHYRVSFDNLKPWQKKVLALLEINQPSKKTASLTACCEGKAEKGEYECHN
jgi:ArsR family transcriptional regulator, arsenate/arsenite/antimonite-responsive transcriptional repressor